MTLYKKEFVRTVKSLVFLLTVAGFVLFICSQGVLPPDGTVSKPVPGGPNYGMKSSNDPALIMPEAAQSLFGQYSLNEFITYPNGFIKYVKLSHVQWEKMAAIISELSTNDMRSEAAQSADAPTNAPSISIEGGNSETLNDGSIKIYGPGSEAPAVFSFDYSITWERFLQLMAQADEILGGGSDFSQTWMSHRFGQIPVTYEDALADHELILSEDKITGAHARLFSDYAGIILGLIPVFPAVFLCLKDRKNIAPLLYTRRVSSAKFVLARFTALLTAIMLPVIVMCAVLTGIHAQEYGAANIDLFAYYKYALLWLMPTAMASTAVGMFFTTLTGTPIAIAVQLLWWFVDTMGTSAAYSFFGVGPTGLIPRHNSLGYTGKFLDYLPDLIQNRIFIAVTALALVALTVLAFTARRRGLINAAVFKHSKIQSQV